jgi:hypothetical protein
MPLKVSEYVEDALVAARKVFPTWGPKKLRKLLLTRHPELPMPVRVDYDGGLEHWVRRLWTNARGNAQGEGARIEFLPTRGRLRDIDWELAAEMASD